MKVRISFTVDHLEIDVPDGADMEKYLEDNAWDLVKSIINDPGAIIPDEWEEVEEE